MRMLKEEQTRTFNSMCMDRRPPTLFWMDIASCPPEMFWTEFSQEVDIYSEPSWMEQCFLR